MKTSSKIILMANQKGGTGSSTIIPLIASQFALCHSLKVLVLDTHSFQKSIVLRRENEVRDYPFYNPMYDVVDVSSENIIAYLGSLDVNYDVILIDWSGRINNKYLANILFAAHAVIIPMLAGDFNVWSTLDFIRYIRTIEQMKASLGMVLKIHGFINMYNERMIEHRNLWRVAAENNIAMLKTTLRSSADYNKYWSTIVPLGATESKIAKEEIEQLSCEILSTLRINKRSA